MLENCKSEGLKCQRDCQKKQGFQVEITRGSSRSKSGRSKTLPFAMATSFLLTSPLTGTTTLLRGLAAWPNATLMPQWHHAFPKTWFSCWAPPTRLETCEQSRHHTHVHAHMGFFLPHSLGCIFFCVCVWLKRPPSTSVMGREVSKVQKWFILFIYLFLTEGRQ